jgi:hypothetical protein
MLQPGYGTASQSGYGATGSQAGYQQQPASGYGAAASGYGAAAATYGQAAQPGQVGQKRDADYSGYQVWRKLLCKRDVPSQQCPCNCSAPLHRWGLPGLEAACCAPLGLPTVHSQFMPDALGP